MGDPRLTSAIQKEIDKEKSKVRTLREVLADSTKRKKFDKAARIQRKIVQELLRIDGKKTALLLAEQAEGLGDGAMRIQAETSAEQRIFDELVKEVDLLVKAGKIREAAERSSALQTELDRIAGKRAARDIARRLLEKGRAKQKKKKKKKKK